MTEAERLARAAALAQSEVDGKWVKFMLRAFRIARAKLQPTITSTLSKISALQDSGQPVDAVLLRRLGSLESLSAEIRQEMTAFSAVSAARVLVEKEAAYNRSGLAAARTVKAITSESLSIPRLAEALISSFADGSAVAAHFAQFGPEAASEAKGAIISGVLAKKPIRSIAANLNAILDVPRNRALLTAKTEVHRVKNLAALTTYRESEFVNAWRRMCSFGPNCCAACVALSGEILTLEEDLEIHPGCECYSVPMTDDARGTAQTGEEWFADQTVERQIQVVGKRGFNLLEDRIVHLSDFVLKTHSDRWGDGIQQKSIAGMIREGIVAPAEGH